MVFMGIIIFKIKKETENYQFHILIWVENKFKFLRMIEFNFFISKNIKFVLNVWMNVLCFTNCKSVLKIITKDKTDNTNSD